MFSTVIVPDMGKLGHCPGKIVVNCGYCLPLDCFMGQWATEAELPDNKDDGPVLSLTVRGRRADFSPFNTHKLTPHAW